MMDFKAKMHQIRFRLGQLTALPRSSSLIWGCFAAGEELGWGRAGKGEGGEVEGREREGPQVTVEPGTLRALLRYC